MRHGSMNIKRSCEAASSKLKLTLSKVLDQPYGTLLIFSRHEWVII